MASQVPRQLSNFRNIALPIKVAVIGVKSTCQPRSGSGIGVVRQYFWIVDGGQRMQICNEKESFVARLIGQFDTWKNRSEEVAEVRNARGLNAG